MAKTQTTKEFLGDNVFGESKTPWNIQTKANKVTGFVESICYECSNVDVSKSVEVTGLIQASFCKQTLKIKKIKKKTTTTDPETKKSTTIDTWIDSPAPDFKVWFDSENVKIDRGNALGFIGYENHDRLDTEPGKKQCPLTKCQLKQLGC